MRIAIFTDTYTPEINGVASSCKALRDVLVKKGNEVLVVTTNPFDNKLQLDEDNVVRVPGIELKQLYDYRLAGFYNSEAMKIVRQFNPEIIHTQTEYGIGLFSRTVADRLKLPIVYTYHTMIEEYTYYIGKGHFDRVMKNTARVIIKTLVNNSDELISPSEKTKDYLRQIGIDTYINVIPTGIDFEKFFPQNIVPGTKEKLREKYGISKDTFTLISLGRIASEKSIDFSIKCFARFLEKHPEIKSKMVIVGKGPAEEELKTLANELGLSDKIIFTGPCQPSEVQDYYTLGDSFVSASLSETQGLTYMEAMAAHLYVMARYDHNLVDVVKDGVTGFFFESEDEFADKFENVYKLFKAGDKTMLEKALNGINEYSIDMFYERIMKVYKHALKIKW